MQINRNLANTTAFQSGLSTVRKAQNDAGSPSESIVDHAANLIKAANTTKAGAKVVHIADEMLGRAIDIKG